MKESDRESIVSEIEPDMKSYFGEMFGILRFQGYGLSLAGMSMGRSTIDIVRDLAITSVQRIGKLNVEDFEDIWQKPELDLYREIKRKIDLGELIPKSKLPEEYRGLFQNIRTLYFLAMEKVKEKGEHNFSFEGTSIGLPVELVSDMLGKIVDSDAAKVKWEEIKGAPDRIIEFYTKTKWQVGDLPKTDFATF